MPNHFGGNHDTICIVVDDKRCLDSAGVIYILYPNFFRWELGKTVISQGAMQNIGEKGEKEMQKKEILEEIIFTGLEPPPKRTYSEYEFLFKNSSDYGTWHGKKNYHNKEEKKNGKYKIL